MAVLHRGVALQTVEHGAGEQLLVDLDGIGGRRTPISHGQRLALHRIGGIKPCNSEALGNIPGRTIGVGHGDGQTAGVQLVPLLVFGLIAALERDAPHLFQRHGLGAVLGGRHGADGGLIALLGRLGGVSIGVTLQQLIGRSLGGRNLRLAVLEGERGILRGHGEGHGDPLCSILRQRNGNAGGSRHGIVLVRHGHAAGLLRVAGAGHGIGIRCIGGRQRHGGRTGISAAVYRKHSILGLNGKGYRRGGGLPTEGGIVPALDHEAIPQQSRKRGGFHLGFSFEVGSTISINATNHKCLGRALQSIAILDLAGSISGRRCSQQSISTAIPDRVAVLN